MAKNETMLQSSTVCVCKTFFNFSPFSCVCVPVLAGLSAKVGCFTASILKVQRNNEKPIHSME